MYSNAKGRIDIFVYVELYTSKDLSILFSRRTYNVMCDKITIIDHQHREKDEMLVAYGDCITSVSISSPCMAFNLQGLC